tara:strand:+ start:1486 stop:1656 length:171 start_codon:yes stop_codon:yes gene_type:complete
MNLQDLKLYALNTATVGVTTFTQLEMGLKIILLIVTICYTISKWLGNIERKKKGKQ